MLSVVVRLHSRHTSKSAHDVRRDEGLISLLTVEAVRFPQRSRQVPSEREVWK